MNKVEPAKLTFEFDFDFKASEKPPEKPEYQKSWFDYLADHFNPGDAPDFFRVAETFTGYLSCLPVSDAVQAVLARVNEGASKCVAALSLPKLFKNVSDLKKEWFYWEQAPAGDPGNFQKATKVWYEFWNILNSGTQAALGLHSSKIFNFKNSVPGINGVCQVTTILTDGQTLVETWTENKGDLTAKCLRVAKYTSSVALAVILLLGIFYAALLQQLVFTILSLSMIYVVTSIIGGVYERAYPIGSIPG
ncbi:MAG TPA: hypothetical protein VLF61_02115 [Rhabdochlamydiaceae bacterium]|nr:hypothetical protein [Rhabdochlamydiaceae bacterium]